MRENVNSPILKNLKSNKKDWYIFHLYLLKNTFKNLWLHHLKKTILIDGKIKWIFWLLKINKILPITRYHLLQQFFCYCLLCDSDKPRLGAVDCCNFGYFCITSFAISMIPSLTLNLCFALTLNHLILFSFKYYLCSRGTSVNSPLSHLLIKQYILSSGEYCLVYFIQYPITSSKLLGLVISYTNITAFAPL